MKMDQAMGPITKCMMSCGRSVVDALARGPASMLCDEHLASYKAREERREDEKREAEKRKLREFIQQRTEVAIPETYSVMQPLNNDDDATRSLLTLNERVRTDDNAKVVSRARAAALAALTVRGLVVLFAGPTGVGKSHMLAFVLRTLAANVPLEPIPMNTLCRRGGDGLFCEDWTHEGDDPVVLWRSSKKLFEAAKRDEDMRPYEDVAVLAIDDIGNEPRQANITIVHDLVFERYDNRRLVLASTGFMDENADPNDLDAFLAPLAARYDKAFVRRLAMVPERVRVIPMLPPDGFKTSGSV